MDVILYKINSLFPASHDIIVEVLPFFQRILNFLTCSIKREKYKYLKISH